MRRQLRWKDERKHKGIHCLFIQTCPSISPPSSAEAGILSEASKHVDFSLALTKLAHGTPGVNELVFDREGWRGGGGSFPHSPDLSPSQCWNKKLHFSDFQRQIS